MTIYILIRGVTSDRSVEGPKCSALYLLEQERSFQIEKFSPGIFLIFKGIKYWS